MLSSILATSLLCSKLHRPHSGKRQVGWKLLNFWRFLLRSASPPQRSHVVFSTRFPGDDNFPCFAFSRLRLYATASLPFVSDILQKSNHSYIMYINTSVYEPNIFCERNRYHSIRETPTCSSGAVSAETDALVIIGRLHRQEDFCGTNPIMG